MTEMQQTLPSPDAVGVVVIGRNEGERLQRCLESLIDQGAGPMVYVDSGSTDGSVEYAQSRGVWVEALDMSRPFTMARGRNTGFEKLMQLYPDLRWVQFVDGDCEVESGWVSRGLSFLKEHQDVVAVCGFRRERFPQASTYNRLIDMEWQGPSGEIGECGGDALYRTEAFSASGGFDISMIAGEEPELCVRLRKQGGKIWRVDAPMTLHDANMTGVGQWWKRSVRSGHAYAEGFDKQGAAPWHHNRKPLRSCLILGALIPLAWLVSMVAWLIWPVLAPLAILTSLAALLALLKSALGARKARLAAGDSTADARFYGFMCLAGKLPEAQGALKYYLNKLRGRRSGLIEYKKD